MSPVTLAFGFLLITGVVGQVCLSNVFRFLPAHDNIDHPSRPVRIFFRIMAICMCQFWSFIFTIALLGASGLAEYFRWVRHSDEFVQALFVLVVPLPLMVCLYFLYARLVRWAARQEQAR